jgi:hypothetical protein
MKRERDLPAAAQDEWLTEQLRDSELSLAYLNAALAEGDQAAFGCALATHHAVMFRSPVVWLWRPRRV